MDNGAGDNGKVPVIEAYFRREIKGQHLIGEPELRMGLFDIVDCVSNNRGAGSKR